MARKKEQEIQATPTDPELLNPTSSTEFAQRAWLFYGRKKYDQAESDFNKALERDSDNLENLYGLALSKKASGKGNEALVIFEKVSTLVESMEDNQRQHILIRLLHGQINQIKTGDWNLEKEVWQSVH